MINNNQLVSGHLKKVINKNTKEVIKNTWDLIIEVDRDSEANRKRKSIRYKGTKKEAEAELYRLRRYYSGITTTEQGEIKLSDYLRKWIQSVKPDGSDYTLRQLTWEGYYSIIENHLIPELGAIRLSELQPQHIASYKEKKLSSGGRFDANKKEGISSSTLNRHLTTLNQALEDAASPEKQLISINPMKLVKRAGRKGKKTTNWQVLSNYLLPTDLNELLDSIKHYDIYPITFAAAYTGMRISEVLGLRWKDINFIKKEITVARSAHHGRTGYHINPTKTGKPRTIVVGNKLIAMLKKHRSHQQKNKKVLDFNDLVFTRNDGKEYKRSTVSSIFSDAAKLYGYPNITFHGLRHTHATLLLMASVPVPVVSERLGHSEYSTTLNEYVHAVPSLQFEAAKTFDEIIDKGENRLYHSQTEVAELIDQVIED